jgi:hypothetical protein
MREERKRLDAAFKSIMKAAVRQPLAAHGFRTHRQGVKRSIGGVVQVVLPYRFPWSSGDSTEFTVEFGVFVPGLWWVIGGQEIESGPTIGSCAISDRLGDLGPDRIDRSRTLTLATLDQDVAREIADISLRVARDLVPWFDGLADLRRVAAALAAGQRGAHPGPQPPKPGDWMTSASATAFLLGEFDRALHLAEESVRTEWRKIARQHAEAYRDRLVRLVAEAKARGGAPLPPAAPAPKT